VYRQQEQTLSRRGALLAALFCAGLGVAASVTTADLFILGLEQLESNEKARESLRNLGILIIASELAAFGLAAWMPPKQLWAQRWKLYLFGTALLCFEFWTLTATNIALVQTADAAGSARHGRIVELRASIQSQRKTAEGLRANAAHQSASKYSWIRSAGADTLKQAADIESRIAPIASELASLEAGQRPTLSTALGNKGMERYSIARGLIPTILGIVFFGVAGALVRESRAGSPPSQPPVSKPESVSMKARFAIGTAAPFAAVPAAAFAVPAQPPIIVPETVLDVVPAPVPSTTQKAAPVPVLAKASKPRPARAEAVKVRPASKRTPADEETRYRAVVAAVEAKQVQPTIRGIKAYLGCGQKVAERIMSKLKGEGMA
jgi:hypothetical protein